MYRLINFELKQMNKGIELQEKPSIDSGIHWLNPLYPKYMGNYNRTRLKRL